MPEMIFFCPNCGQRLEAAPEMAGAQVECPACHQSFIVPAQQDEGGINKLRLKNSGPPQVPSCPHCNLSLPPDTVICMNCGRDLRTGKKLKTGQGIAWKVASLLGRKSIVILRRFLSVGGQLVLPGMLLAACLFPYYLGYRAQLGIRSSIEQINQTTGLKLRLLNYDRGWFKSSAESVLDIKTDAEGMIRLKHNIDHLCLPWRGYVIRVETTPDLPPKFMELFNQYFEGGTPFSLENRVHLSGSQDITLTTPSYAGASKRDKNVKIIWSGIDCKLFLGANAATFSGEVNVPTLSLTTPDGNAFSLENLTLKLDARQAPGELWLGSTRLSVDALAFANPSIGAIEKERGKLSGFSFTVETSVKNSSLALRNGITCALFSVNDEAFRNCNFEASLSDIDLETVSKLVKNIRRIRELDLSTDKSQAMMQDELRVELPVILRKHPEAHAALRVESPVDQGTINAQATVKYTGQASALDNWGRDLEGTVNVRMSSAFRDSMIRVEGARLYQDLRTKHHLVTGAWPNEALDKELRARSANSSQNQPRDEMFAREGGDYVIQATLKDGELSCKNKVLWSAPK